MSEIVEVSVSGGQADHIPLCSLVCLGDRRFLVVGRTPNGLKLTPAGKAMEPRRIIRNWKPEKKTQ